jgi:transposase
VSARLPIRHGGAVVAHALLDPEDLPVVARFRWRLQRDGYAVTSLRSPGGDSIAQLHRLVLGLHEQRIVDYGRWGNEIVLQIDHKDANALNCQKANLRLTSPAGNSAKPVAARPGRLERTPWCHVASAGAPVAGRREAPRPDPLRRALRVRGRGRRRGGGVPPEVHARQPHGPRPGGDPVTDRCTATTKAGAPCRAWPIRGQTICRTHAGDTRRPRLLNEETEARIVLLLRHGNFMTTAAQASGVGTTTIYRWLEHGEADHEHGLATPLARFWQACARARAEAEVAAVARVTAAAWAGDWRAAAWWLERAHPERWGKRARVESTTTTTASRPPSRWTWRTTSSGCATSPRSSPSSTTRTSSRDRRGTGGTLARRTRTRARASLPVPLDTNVHSIPPTEGVVR